MELEKSESDESDIVQERIVKVENVVPLVLLLHLLVDVVHNFVDVLLDLLVDGDMQLLIAVVSATRVFESGQFLVEVTLLQNLELAGQNVNLSVCISRVSDLVVEGKAVVSHTVCHVPNVSHLVDRVGQDPKCKRRKVVLPYVCLLVEFERLGHAQLDLLAHHSARFKQLLGRVQVSPLFLVVLLEMVEQLHERGCPHALHVDLHLSSDKVDLAQVE